MIPALTFIVWALRLIGNYVRRKKKYLKYDHKMPQSPESVVTGVKHPSLETQTIRCSLRILQVLKWFHSYEA